MDYIDISRYLEIDGGDEEEVLRLRRRAHIEAPPPSEDNGENIETFLNRFAPTEDAEPILAEETEILHEPVPLPADISPTSNVVPVKPRKKKHKSTDLVIPVESSTPVDTEAPHAVSIDIEAPHVVPVSTKDDSDKEDLETEKETPEKETPEKETKGGNGDKKHIKHTKHKKHKKNLIEIKPIETTIEPVATVIEPVETTVEPVETTIEPVATVIEPVATAETFHTVAIDCHQDEKNNKDMVCEVKETIYPTTDINDLPTEAKPEVVGSSATFDKINQIVQKYREKVKK